MEVRLHGDVGQDQPQRHRALPGAPQPGQEEKHEPQHRRQALGEAVPRRETEREMQCDVKTKEGEEEEGEGGRSEERRKRQRKDSMEV